MAALVYGTTYILVDVLTQRNLNLKERENIQGWKLKKKNLKRAFEEVDVYNKKCDIKCITTNIKD